MGNCFSIINFTNLDKSIDKTEREKLKEDWFQTIGISTK